MTVLRNKLSSTVSGGPRQFAELRDRLVISSPTDEDRREVTRELNRVGFNVRELANAPVLVASPEGMFSDVLERVREDFGSGEIASEAVDSVRDSESVGEQVMDIGRATLDATDSLIRRVRGLPGVRKAQFANSLVDYGPENLRLDIGELQTITGEEGNDQAESLSELNERLNVEQAWETTRGENSIIAIFDTGYARDVIGSSRIVAEWSGDDVSNVYAPAEGHGTMTAAAAAANKEEGVPHDGMAPEAGVVLVRLTDSAGQIRSDYMAEAWDWLISRNFDRPVVSNHSYGTPLCSGRPKVRFCESPEIDVIKAANADQMMTACYAAGNEAMRCGHRPSGLTNGITGANSIAEVITVGALLFNGREAQRYSSHGRGDCAPVSDPKPNVSCRIPNKTYYGAEGGYKIKDMGTGLFGSGGGTSHASPSVSGIVALMQSAATAEDGDPLQTEEIKQILEDTSELPHRNQVNSIGAVFSRRGYDARFGYGEIRPPKAVNEASN